MTEAAAEPDPQSTATRVRAVEKLLEAGEIAAAEQALKALLDALWTAGRASVAANRPRDAALIFADIVKLAPRSIEALTVLGSLHLDLEDPVQAQACFERVLELDRRHAGAWNALGLITARAGADKEALRLLRRAVQYRHVFPEARNNLGNVHAKLGQSAEAIKHYRMAVAQRPDYADAWFNLADELSAMGRGDEAMAACERCLAILPTHALAHLRRAYLLLAGGYYEAGWREHEWRVAAQTGASYYRDPRGGGRLLRRPSSWAGRDLAGRRLLVLPEEGIGDELFCLRFVAILRARGAEVAYLPSPKLRPILATTMGLDAVVAADAGLLSFDFALAIGDLGLVALAQGGEPVPPPFPLKADEAGTRAARAKLAQTGPPPYLGVTWRAGVAADRARRKRIDVDELGLALAHWPGTLVAIQRGGSNAEIGHLARAAGRPVADRCAEADDLEAMVTLLASLDDYVGVSNTNMHVLASLGRPGRVLVRAASEWRWGQAGARSPWFPALEVYRERAGRGWRDELVRLRRDLAAGARP